MEVEVEVEEGRGKFEKFVSWAPESAVSSLLPKVFFVSFESEIGIFEFRLSFFERSGEEGGVGSKVREKSSSFFSLLEVEEKVVMAFPFKKNQKNTNNSNKKRKRNKILRMIPYWD